MHCRLAHISEQGALGALGLANASGCTQCVPLLVVVLVDAQGGLCHIGKSNAEQATRPAAEGKRLRPHPAAVLLQEGSFKKDLQEQTYPEILRSNLGSVVLQLKKLGIDDLVRHDRCTPNAPSPVQLHYEQAVSLPPCATVWEEQGFDIAHISECAVSQLKGGPPCPRCPRICHLTHTRLLPNLAGSLRLHGPAGAGNPDACPGAAQLPGRPRRRRQPHQGASRSILT